MIQQRIKMFFDATPKESMALLKRLKEFAVSNNLTNRELSEKVGIPYDTLRGWPLFTSKKEPKNPSRASIGKIRDFLNQIEHPDNINKLKEARHRTEKIKYLLLLLEDELRWFKNADPAIRDEYRKGLHAPDIGYVSSLLTMLTDEDKFHRWQALTTARFQFFQRK
ncbi:MAG: hypothetical protein Q8N56_00290 [bacterium]|nr:hypothetical protein [bacterium]